MKINVALVTGGFTDESVISLKSAQVIESNLNTDLYNVYKIIITVDSWYYVDDNAIKHAVDKNAFTLNINDKLIHFDLAFIGLHGTPGEDGKLQGYFDMIGLPYTSCDAATSALTMNKAYSKALVGAISGLYTASSVCLLKNEITEELTKLKYPVFVKPNTGGSSIGMSKVKHEENLQEALEKAFKHDSQVLVEEFIEGREFTIGVYKGRQSTTVLPSTELISSKEFFDFEAKYTPGITEEITPGRMTLEEKERVERIVVDIFKTLNCRGVVRIDYILEKETGHFYFIEVNTVPGQTEGSLIPQQVAAAGLNMREFYTELIDCTLEAVKL